LTFEKEGQYPTEQGSETPFVSLRLVQRALLEPPGAEMFFNKFM